MPINHAPRESATVAIFAALVIAASCGLAASWHHISHPELPTTNVVVGDHNALAEISTWRVIGAFPLPASDQIYTTGAETSAMAHDYLHPIGGSEAPLIIPPTSTNIPLDFTHDIYDDTTLTGDKTGTFINQQQRFPASIVTSQNLFWHTFEVFKILYAASIINTPRETVAVFIISGNSPIKVWLNGRVIIDPIPGSVGHDPDSRAITPVHLQQGHNVILLKEFCFPLRNNFVLRVATPERALQFLREHSGLPDILDQVIVPLGARINLSDNLKVFASMRSDLVKAEIRDVTGKAITNTVVNLRSSKLELDTGGLPSGIYSAHLLVGGNRLSENFFLGDLTSLLSRYRHACRHVSSMPRAYTPCTIVEPLAKLVQGAGPSRRLDKDLPIVMLVSQIEWRLRHVTPLTAIPDQRRFHLISYRSPIDWQNHYYYLHLPPGYKRKTPVPLVLILASHPDRHPFLNAAPTTATDALRGYLFQADRFGYAVVVPFLRGERDGVFTTGDALASIADVEHRYAIDARRIYVSGDCEDGRAAILFAERFPGRFAAVSAGRALTGMDAATGEYWRDVDNPLLYLPNLHSTPVRLVHGDYFPHSPTIQATRFKQDALRAGNDVDLLIIPGDGELAERSMTYLEFEFFHDKTAPSPPRTLEFTTRDLRFNSDFWIEIASLESFGEPASVSADLSRATVAKVITRNIAALRFKRAALPSSSASQKAISVIINGVPQREWRLADDHSPEYFVSEAGSGRPLKSHDVEGPIADAFARPFTVVIGTGGSVRSRREAKRLVGEIRSLWAKDYQLRCDTARDVDLSVNQAAQRNLIVVGKISPESELGRLRQDVPMHFTKQGVRIGDRYTKGSDLIAAAVYPNPLNSHRYIVVVDYNGTGDLPTADLASAGVYDAFVWKLGVPAVAAVQGRWYWASEWRTLR